MKTLDIKMTKQKLDMFEKANNEFSFFNSADDLQKDDNKRPGNVSDVLSKAINYKNKFISRMSNIVYYSGEKIFL